MYCNIIVTRPFNQSFTYNVGLKKVKRGHLAIVPFGKSTEIGIIIDINVQKPNYDIKKVIKILDSICFSESTINFIEWINNYTLEPIGSILKLFLINKKIIEFDNPKEKKLQIHPKKVFLNDEQKKAKNLIKKFLNTSSKPILLEGITGSGKTEVYFDIIETFIIKKKQILIMVPEISLTPQLERRFFERFGIEVEIWHSKISEKKRQKVWHQSYRGDPLIIIGARSSLFLPFTKLGLIIIDEEHDPSYKQEDSIRYQARDLAVVRSKYHNCGLILSSATPSLETQNNVNKKKYHHVFLANQFSGLPLPAVHLIDLTKNKLERNHWISPLIISELSKCLEKKQQALIFLNRRGYSPLSLCSNCGYRFQCNNCSSWLVKHQEKKRLVCHHCGEIKQLTNNCPKCLGKNTIKSIGPGIERVAEELSNHFPTKNINIMSSDNANTTKKIKLIIEKFSKNKIDILVATQIMAKGYDFPNLSFVGVIDADAGLFGGDMRAVEKTFNLLQQVSGRAGRAKQRGKVLIQTYYPEQPVIKSLKNQDRNSFVKQALKDRENFKIPPFGYMTSLIISGPFKSKLEKYASQLVKISNKDKEISLLGPVEAPIFLLRGKYRYRILLKGNNRKNLNKLTLNMLKISPKPASIKVVVDVDPYSFM